MNIRSFLNILITTLIMTMSLVPCFAGAVELAPQSGAQALAAIENITIAGEGDAAELVIKLSRPATYTSYKTTAPFRLVIDLSQTTEGGVTTPRLFTTGNFKTVTASRFDTDAGVLTRVDIELVKDGEALISSSPEKPGEMRISFPNSAKNKGVAPSVLPVAEALPPVVKTGVEANRSAVEPPLPVALSSRRAPHALTDISAKGGAIVLTVTGGVGGYKTARYHKPDRVVIDLLDTQNAVTIATIPLDILGVAVARIGVLSDKVRVVLESASGRFPAEIETKLQGDQLLLFSGNPAAPAVTADAAESSLKLTATRSGVQSKGAVVDPPAVTPPSAVSQSERSVAAQTGSALVEMIDFQVLDGVSRVAIKTSGGGMVEPLTKGDGFVTAVIKNATLPKQLQHSLETQAFASPVLRITPLQLKKRSGIETDIRIALRVDAPYTLKREADMTYIEFQHPAGGMIVSSAVNTTATPSQTVSTAGLSHGKAAQKNYTGKKVSLDFDNAEIRHVFRLLADVSEKNFIVGDDVKGNISIKLANVPWQQALDVILDTSGLVLREDGNVVTIMTKEKHKAKTKEELEAQEQLLKSQREKVKLEELETAVFSINYSDVANVVTLLNARKTERGSITQDTRTNKVIATDTPQTLENMRKLVKLLDAPEKQVMIEARIVEASSTFIRSLGINWGAHYRDGSAALLGINQLDSSFGGLAANSAPTTGVSGNSGAAMGISFGTLTSNMQLDLRLNAAASAGMIKIVSAPKVSTLNNKTAKITQGQQVPYTSSTSDKVETKFVEAALSLEVTPHINANGTIGMKIDAKNDSVGQATGGSTAPAINKKQATTEMLLRDGETTVIGGIYVDSDNETDEGVPYLMDIPYLGKLFRSINKTKIKTELLIFITPRILEDV